MRFRHMAMIAFAASVAGGCDVVSRVSVGGGDDDAQIVGSGPVKSEVRSVGTFHKVSLNSGLRATIQVGGKQSVQVKAMSNILQTVDTKVKGDELVVDIKQSMSSNKPIEILITVPSLSSLSVNGGVSADVKGLKASTFTFTGSGGTSVHLQGAVDKLSADLDGGCTLTLNGSAKSATIDSNGGCTMDATKFPIGSVKVASSGGSTVSLGKTASLDARADGGATISYQGHPKVIRSDHDVSGTISGG